MEHIVNRHSVRQGQFICNIIHNFSNSERSHKFRIQLSLLVMLVDVHSGQQDLLAYIASKCKSVLWLSA